MTPQDENFSQAQTLLEKLAYSIASDAKINLSTISLENGRSLGCSDRHLLSLSSGRKTASVTITQKEMHSYLQADGKGAASQKVQLVLFRLREELDPR